MSPRSVRSYREISGLGDELWPFSDCAKSATSLKIFGLAKIRPIKGVEEKRENGVGNLR